LRTVLSSFALALLAGTAHAGDQPLYKPAPAWVHPAPAIDIKAVTNDDPMILRLDQQHRLEGDQVWSYVDMMFHIASPEVMMQAGTLQFPWDPANGDLVVHSVEILRGGETIDLLKAGQKFTVLRREQMLERAQLNGLLTATMAVEGLRVGDVLHVVVSTVRRDPALGGRLQVVAPLILQPAPVKYAHLRVMWPTAMKVSYKSQYLADSFGTAPIAGFTEMNLNLPLPEMPDMPSDAPARFRPLPLFEAATFADWQDVSRVVAPLYKTEGAIAPGGPIAAEVAKIAAASSDPRVRAAMALQLVQDQVRYLYRGMDGGNYVPQTPAETWTLRYGDCKAKTLLLLAILRALDIEADAALVNSSLGDNVPNRVPAPAAFDHVIVRATIGGKTLWLDGTNLGSRLADLDDVPAFRNALPLRPEGAKLEAMPLRGNARPDAAVDVELDGRAGIGFPAPFKIRAELRGSTAMLLRFSSQMGKEKSAEMADGIVGQYVDNAQVSDREVRYDDASGATILTASGIATPGWSKEDGRYRLSLDKAVGNLDFTPDRTNPEWAKIPVTMGDPDSKHVRTRIRMPAGGTGFVLEGDQALPPSLAGATFARTTQVAGEWVTVDDVSTTGLKEIAPADIPTVRAQVDAAKLRLLKLDAPEDTPPSWKAIAPARAAKLFDPILAAYAKRITDKPSEEEGYSARATFLESIYDRKGALADLDKIIAIAPSADNYLWRARLRSALGDDVKALDDVKKARTIEPGSAAALGQYTDLRADHGGGDEALALVADRLKSAGKDRNGIVQMQAALLAKTGKAPEAITALDTAIKAAPGNPELLNSRCWTKGTRSLALDTALKDCTKAIELSENPSYILDSRGLVYFRLGRMDDALADFDAALDQAPGMAGSLFMRGVIRKKLGQPGADEDLAGARLISPRIDEEYAGYGITP
jgi:tetratricopeptide (TPR) repeat protein/transglutaminase-like putative cysteine protease